MSARKYWKFYFGEFWSSLQVFEMARRILWSQQDLDAGNLQDFTLEGNNTLAEGGRDAEPPSKRKKIMNDDNNAKGGGEEEAAAVPAAEAETEAATAAVPAAEAETEAAAAAARAAAEAEAEGEGYDGGNDDDDDDDDDDDSNEEEEQESADSEEELLSQYSPRVLRKMKAKHSDLESRSDEEGLISHEDGFYSDDEKNYTIDYADSQDLWESEDCRENDYGLGHSEDDECRPWP